MALQKNTLELEFSRFFDPKNANFVAFPKDKQETAEFWAKSVNEYAKLVTPISNTSILAKEQFYTQMLLVDGFNGDIVLKNAFMQYALQLAIGMSVSGFVGTAPLQFIDFNAVYVLGLNNGSNKQCMDLLISIIDSWFRLGTAVPQSGGSVINWS